MKKRRSSGPVRVEGYTFGQMIERAVERARNAPPPTPEQVAETERILKQLNEVNARLGEPPLMRINVSVRRPGKR